MKKSLFASIIAGLLAIGLTTQAAEPVSHVEGRFVTSKAITNSTGRPLLIQSVFLADSAAAFTNAITFKFTNTQDTDLTGTNATQTAVTYTLGAVTYTGVTNFTPGTAFQIPNGAVFIMTNAVAFCTNDFIMIRSEIQ